MPFKKFSVIINQKQILSEEEKKKQKTKLPEHFLPYNI